MHRQNNKDNGRRKNIIEFAGLCWCFTKIIFKTMGYESPLSIFLHQK